MFIVVRHPSTSSYFISCHLFGLLSWIRFLVNHRFTMELSLMLFGKNISEKRVMEAPSPRASKEIRRKDLFLVAGRLIFIEELDSIEPETQ